MTESYFKYGEKEIAHLKKVDKQLGAVIDQIGMIQRPIISDLFTALVHAIVSQQISNKARDTVWQRITSGIKEITPAVIHAMPVEDIQQYGISFRKASYIKSAAGKIYSGELDLNALYNMSDEEVSAKLTELKGIGTWTAEMLMLFSMQRPNIMSYADLAIKRGLQMLYQHEDIDKQTFYKYHKRYSPYASVASLYLWKFASGTIEDIKDQTPKVI